MALGFVAGDCEVVFGGRIVHDSFADDDQPAVRGERNEVIGAIVALASAERRIGDSLVAEAVVDRAGWDETGES